jgi:hypothetical protein
MQVYVPSRSRFERSLTLNALDIVRGQVEIYLVVPAAQLRDYRRLADQHHIELLGCRQDGIARTRQFIGQHADDKFLMLDDDLRFFHRPAVLEDGADNTSAKLFKIDTLESGMLRMLAAVRQALDRYAHVAISAREGNNRLAWPYVLCNRPLRALAYRKDPFMGCEHGRVAIMEDFDVTLQLMKAGHANCIITKYAQDQVQTQMAGGCSDYRTHELHAKNVQKLAALHDPFVKLRWKENLGGGEFGRRQEATIYWKKAYDSALGEWS